MADTFDTLMDIIEAMNVHGEKYNDDLLAMEGADFDEKK